MLRKIADNLDAGTSHLDEKGCHKVLNTINLMENGDEELSKFNSDDKLANYREYLTFLRKNATDENIKQTLLKIKHLTGKMPTILDQIH